MNPRNMLDRDASAAKSLVLATLILEGVFTAIGVLVLVIAVIGTVIGGVDIATIGIMTAVFMVFFAIGIMWLLLDYYLVYKPLAQERVYDAETPSIVLGILQLIFAGIIPGILLIIAYVKIRDSIGNLRRAQPYAAH